MMDTSQPMRGAPVVVLDTETTGFESSARIVEIALVRFEAFGVKGCRPEVLLHSLVDPGEPIPKAATEVHGITDKMVKGEPRWDQVWSHVRSHLQSAVPVAHGYGYDLRVLQAEADNIDSDGVPAKESWLDTMTLSRRVDAEHSNHKLGACCDRYDIPKGTHRARTDAMATALLLEKLLNKLYGEAVRQRLRPPERPTVEQMLGWMHRKKRGKAGKAGPGQAALQLGAKGAEAPEASAAGTKSKPRRVVPAMPPEPERRRVPIELVKGPLPTIRICNDPGVGRRATVLLPDGTFRWGHVCPPDFQRPAAPTSVVVWEGIEVINEEVDKFDRVVIDAWGDPTWQHSDRGSGGMTKQRGTEGCHRRVLVVVDDEQPLANVAAK